VHIMMGKPQELRMALSSLIRSSVFTGWSTSLLDQYITFATEVALLYPSTIGAIRVPVHHDSH
jgi:hypothetical protein